MCLAAIPKGVDFTGAAGSCGGGKAHYLEKTNLDPGQLARHVSNDVSEQTAALVRLFIGEILKGCFPAR